MDILSGTAGKHRSLTSEDASKQTSDPQKLEQVPQVDAGEGTSISRKRAPVLTPVGSGKNEIDNVTNELTRTKPDCAIREVDFYYGARGPARSSGTRRLKTGPAAPVGWVSSITDRFKGVFGGKEKGKRKGFEFISAPAPLQGWIAPSERPTSVSSTTGLFKDIFGGRTKEKGKGFEVVRSARAPPQGWITPSKRPSSAQDSYYDAEEGHYHDDEAPNRNVQSEDANEQSG